MLLGMLFALSLSLCCRWIRLVSIFILFVIVIVVFLGDKVVQWLFSQYFYRCCWSFIEVPRNINVTHNFFCYSFKLNGYMITPSKWYRIHSEQFVFFSRFPLQLLTLFRKFCFLDQFILQIMILLTIFKLQRKVSNADYFIHRIFCISISPNYLGIQYFPDLNLWIFSIFAAPGFFFMYFWWVLLGLFFANFGSWLYSEKLI